MISLPHTSGCTISRIHQDMSVSFQNNTSWFVDGVLHLSHNFWCVAHRKTHGLALHNHTQLKSAYQVVVGCGRVPNVGVPRDGRIINDEPGLGDDEKRVRLRYLMDTVQQYGQLYDQQSRFLTHPDSRYMMPEDVNSKLNQGTLEVVVQGINMDDDSYGVARMYNRPQDDVIAAVPPAIHKQGSGVYIKAGRPVALLEMEVIDDASDEMGINSIMDHRFTPTAVNEWAKEDHVYSIVSDGKDRIRPSSEMKADVRNKAYTWDHAHECMKPAFVAGEMRRYVTELSVQDDSASEVI